MKKGPLKVIRRNQLHLLNVCITLTKIVWCQFVKFV